MKILFICTAHNSLSQRLYLSLSQLHTVTIEYALSDEAMREAARLVKPDLIICPFLTSRVPTDIYEEFMTLIVHPGPPGDAGPSSLDWVLMGDDGSVEDPAQLLQQPVLSEKGRPYWGVTVLQAEDQFDAGPVWAYEQFAVDIDEPGLTKSGLYRGPVTRAAVSACLAAVDRIHAAAYTSAPMTPPLTPESSSCPSPKYRTLHPGLVASPQFKELSVELQKPFLGGPTHHRPLLKAAQRDFDVKTHDAREISRRIRCSDSQPGCLSSVLGQNMYIYGGTIEEEAWIASTSVAPGTIVAVRDQAVCFKTTDSKGIWITHVRRVKKKTDAKLWPKIPAVSGLREVRLLTEESIGRISRPYATQDWSKAASSTNQDIWVDFVVEDQTPIPNRAAYVYSDFYNGAMSTAQCEKLVEALQFVLGTHTAQDPLAAVVMMGGAGYFSNGIHLNVIEAAADPAAESWTNINRINDVVYHLLHEFPRRQILTFAGVRGNAAAGGVALAAACDCVVAGADVVLNPAYRALGLHGSEYHSVSYFARCGAAGARRLLRDMLPLSADDARAVGLVDHVLPGHGALLDACIRNHVRAVVRSIGTSRSGEARYLPGAWKAHVADLSPAGLARARAAELGEMALDFWSARAVRYHSRRGAFVRKMKAASTPLRFAKHRREGVEDGGVERVKLDEEETDDFDSVAYFAQKAAQEFEDKLTAGIMSKVSLGIQAGGAGGGIGLALTGNTAVKAQGQEPIFTCYYGA